MQIKETFIINILFLLTLTFIFPLVTPNNDITPLTSHSKTFFEVNSTSQYKFFSFTINPSEDIILRFELGNAFTVDIFIFTDISFTTTFPSNTNSTLHFKLTSTEFILKSSSFPKQTKTIYIAIYDNKYSYSDYLTIFNENDIIPIKANTPLIVNRFYSKGKFTFHYVSPTHTTSIYQLQLNKKGDTPFRRVEVYSHENNKLLYSINDEFIVDTVIRVDEKEKQQELYINVYGKESDGKFSIMLMDYIENAFVKLGKDEIYEKAFVLMGKYYFYYEIEDKEEAIGIIRHNNKINKHLDVEIEADVVVFDINISEMNGTLLYQTLYNDNNRNEIVHKHQCNIISETDPYHNDVTNYFILNNNDHSHTNSITSKNKQFIIISLSFKYHHSSYITPDTFYIQINSHTQQIAVNEATPLDKWEQIHIDLNKKFIFIKYTISSHVGILIHNTRNNAISIINNSSNKIFTLDNIALINFRKDKINTFIIKITNNFAPDNYSDNLGYEVFITNKQIHSINNNHELKQVKYYTLCRNEISYVVLYNNYLVKKKEKKDPLFRRFVINVINKDNSITKIENHETLRDVYYEVNTNEDENNLLLLEIMSKEMIKENSISVKLREGNGIAFVNVDNINGMKLVYLLNTKNEVVSEFTGNENENEVAIDINNKDELNDGNFQLELFAYTNINNNTLIEKYNRVNISVVTEYHKGNKVILIHSQYEFIMKQIISIIIVCICLFILSIISFKFLIFFKSDNTIVI